MTLSEAQERAERAIRSAPVTARRAENVVRAFRVCLEWTCATEEQKRAWCERVAREYEGNMEQRLAEYERMLPAIEPGYAYTGVIGRGEACADVLAIEIVPHASAGYYYVDVSRLSDGASTYTIRGIHQTAIPYFIFSAQVPVAQLKWQRRECEPAATNPFVPTANKRKFEGVVYFVQAQTLRLIKIGFSTSPEFRLEALQTGSPDHLVLLGTMQGGPQNEAELHKRFAAFRSHGEWYYAVADLLDYIREHTV